MAPENKLTRLAPTLTASILAGIEVLLNEILRLDASSAEKLGQLEGRWLQIEITPFGQRCYLCAGYPLRLTLELTDQADVIVSGSPGSLLRFWQYAESTSMLSITGDQSLAEEMANISSKLDIDWESKLAEIIGNLPAHIIGNRLREAQSWTHYVQKHFFQDAEEYLHHESRLIPDSEEVKLWKEDIIDLTDHLAVLEKRLQKLEAIASRANPAYQDTVIKHSSDHDHSSSPANHHPGNKES